MLKKLLERVPIKVLLIVFIFLSSLLIFAFLADGVMHGKERVFDKISRDFLVKHSTPGLVEVMRFFTFLGSSTFLLPAYIVLILAFFIRRNFRKGLNILVVSSSSFLVMQ